MKLPWNWIIGKRLNKMLPKKLQTSIHSEKTLEQIILQERTRSDRNGHPFSLVVFDVNEKSKDSFEKLLRIIHSRETRLCDEVGWFLKQHIAVILCYTDRQSAFSFAEDIRYKASSIGQSIKYTVYEYPDNWQDFYFKSVSLKKQNLNSIIKESDKNNFRSSNFISRKEDGHSSKVVSIPINKQNLNNLRRNIKIPMSFKYGIPAWKRTIDVIVSLLGLIVLLPLFLSLSMVIKILSPGPVFVKEEKVGFLGKRLVLWRFRTEKIKKSNTEK